MPVAMHAYEIQLRVGISSVELTPMQSDTRKSTVESHEVTDCERRQGFRGLTLGPVFLISTAPLQYRLSSTR
jgi:hypothetical protein